MKMQSVSLNPSMVDNHNQWLSNQRQPPPSSGREAQVTCASLPLEGARVNAECEFGRPKLLLCKL